MKPHSFYLVFLILTVFFTSPASAQFSGNDSAILRESFLDSLNVGSTIKLKVHASVGCITLHDIDISIQRQKKGYVATASYHFKSGNGDKWRKTAKQVRLTAAQIDTLKQIEQDMINAQIANDVAGVIVSSSQCSQSLSSTFIKRGRRKTYDFVVCEVGSFTRFTDIFFGKIW
jgi:hypothetical protein